MKSAFIIFLVVLVIVLGFNVSSLRKELLNAKESAVFYEKRSDDLQRELMRVSRLYSEEERVLDEIEESITELESKINLETLERYIPKKAWEEIKPIIDRLKAFQETRENNNPSREYEKGHYNIPDKQ